MRGATAYVTLEPCSHHGRTPPCSEALIAAGLGRVVAAMVDPNPLVAGRGLAQLEAAGIAVRSGIMAREAQELNIGFFSRMVRGRPWVRLKVAASLDGVTALASGESQWITGAEARADGHAWRARACAIVTGIGTVKADNPQLTVRGLATPMQPRRVIVDSRLEIDPDAHILQGEPCWIVAAAGQPGDEKAAALRAAGHEVLYLPNAHGKVDLPALMRELGRREINEVHVEAGSKLNASLVREGCVDELLVYLAPSLIGAGAGHVRPAAAARNWPNGASCASTTSRASATTCASWPALPKLPNHPLLPQQGITSHVYWNRRRCRHHHLRRAAGRRPGRRRAPRHRCRRPAAGRRGPGRLDRHQRRLHDRRRKDRHRLRGRRLARKPEQAPWAWTRPAKSTSKRR